MLPCPTSYKCLHVGLPWNKEDSICKISSALFQCILNVRDVVECGFSLSLAETEKFQLFTANTETSFFPDMAECVFCSSAGSMSHTLTCTHTHAHTQPLLMFESNSFGLSHSSSVYVPLSLYFFLISFTAVCFKPQCKATSNQMQRVLHF